MCVCILYISLNTCLLCTDKLIYTIRAYCNVATIILVTVTSPYRYRVQYINLIHYNMKAKRISQKAVKEDVLNYINENNIENRDEVETEEEE